MLKPTFNFFVCKRIYVQGVCVIFFLYLLLPPQTDMRFLVAYFSIVFGNFLYNKQKKRHLESLLTFFIRLPSSFYGILKGSYFIYIFLYPSLPLSLVIAVAQ